MRCASARIAAAFALAVFAAMAAPALALQHVHVTVLSIQADRTHVRIGEQFHLIVRAHVRESVPRLDGVVLPDLVDFNTIADERQYNAGPGGTDYVETLTLNPLREGKFTIGPVVFDVFDTRTKRPVRNSSTNLVQVTVGPLAPLDPWIAVRGFVFALLRAALTAILAIAAIAGLAYLYSRRKRAPLPLVAAPLADPEPAAAPPIDECASALARLRADHDRPSAIAARAYVWRRAGAPEGATLSAVLSMNATLDPALRAALIAAERATFIEPERMHTAIDELIERLERFPA